MGYTVLIFEDDITMVRSLLTNINWSRCDISSHLTANNVPDGRLLFEKHDIDLVICDIEVINGTGLDLLKWARMSGYKTEFILLTNYAEFTYAQEALKLGGNDYILKTDPLEVLEQAIKRSVTRIKLQNHNPFTDDHTVYSVHVKLTNDYLKEPSFSETKADSHWEEWKRHLLNAEKIKLLDSIKAFFDKIQNYVTIDSDFLTSFQHDFIQMTYKTFYIHEIQSGIMLEDNLSAELYRRAPISVFDMIKWLNHYIDRIISCLDKQTLSITLIEKAKSFIQDNYANNINRQNIANAVNVNSDYLSRLFNKQVGISIPEYITRVRIEQAIQLMHSDLPISNISLEVGIDNFSYFSKTFKKFTGMSPTEYKKNLST